MERRVAGLHEETRQVAPAGTHSLSPGMGPQSDLVDSGFCGLWDSGSHEAVLPLRPPCLP